MSLAPPLNYSCLHPSYYNHELFSSFWSQISNLPRGRSSHKIQQPKEALSSTFPQTSGQLLGTAAVTDLRAVSVCATCNRLLSISVIERHLLLVILSQCSTPVHPRHREQSPGESHSLLKYSGHLTTLNLHNLKALPAPSTHTQNYTLITCTHPSVFQVLRAPHLQIPFPTRCCGSPSDPVIQTTKLFLL